MKTPASPQAPPPAPLPGRPLDDAQTRLLATFDELEKGQIASLDQASRRIVELVTLLFGALVTASALGDKFPPSYLAGNALNQGLAVAALALFVLSLLASVASAWPRRYRRYTANLTRLREELDRIVAWKVWTFRVAAACFGLGALALAALLASAVLAV